MGLIEFPNSLFFGCMCIVKAMDGALCLTVPNRPMDYIDKPNGSIPFHTQFGQFVPRLRGGHVLFDNTHHYWPLSACLYIIVTLWTLAASLEARVCKQCRSRWAGSYEPSHQNLHYLQVFFHISESKITHCLNVLVWILFYCELIWSEWENGRFHVIYI